MITSFEFHITALATATDCRWPPDSDATGWRIDFTVVTRHRIFVEQPRAQPFAAQEHVLDDVEVVGEREVLVHGLDAELRCVARIVDVDRPAFPVDLPMVGLIDAGDALRQHGLAGAVVAAQRGDLA
jgi:hypothetical protein